MTQPSDTTYPRGSAERIEWIQRRYPKKEHPQYVNSLDAWSRFAIVDKVLNGLSDKEIAKRYGVNDSRWRKHKKSPEGEAWAERVRKLSEDPATAVRLNLASQGNYAAFRLYAMAEALEAEGNFKEAGRLYAKALELGITQPKKEETTRLQAGVVVLNFSSSQAAALQEAIPEAKWQITSDST